MVGAKSTKDTGSSTNIFDFTPPADSASKFVCESWNKTITYNNRASITATFREVFEP